MCMACEMDAMWFAAMEARARAVAAEAVPQPTQLLPNPPPEEGEGGTAPPTFVCEETQAE
jgi:hypothetical protein